MHILNLRASVALSSWRALTSCHLNDSHLNKHLTYIKRAIELPSSPSLSPTELWACRTDTPTLTRQEDNTELVSIMDEVTGRNLKQSSLPHKRWVSATFPVRMTWMFYSIQHKLILELAKGAAKQSFHVQLQVSLDYSLQIFGVEDHCPTMISYHGVRARLSSVPNLSFCALRLVPASPSHGIRQRAKGIPRVAPWAYLQKAQWRFWRS